MHAVTLARVSLVVDRYALGPLQTNCYVLRAERGAAEAVVVDPGGDAAELRLQYPQFAPAGMPGRSYVPDHLLEGGETISVAGLELECVAIPGHSPAHVAFFTDMCLFSGDLLFAGSVGRVDLPGADWDTLLDSVRTLAGRYPPETVVYPGHGPETTLGVELERNPFLAELRA
jgi:glyoxylase-like metal-dependent hydrolase (beta-lactamase superfamily II)